MAPHSHCPARPPSWSKCDQWTECCRVRPCLVSRPQSPSWRRRDRGGLAHCFKSRISQQYFAIFSHNQYDTPRQLATTIPNFQFAWRILIYRRVMCRVMSPGNFLQWHELYNCIVSRQILNTIIIAQIPSNIGHVSFQPSLIKLLQNLIFRYQLEYL